MNKEKIKKIFHLAWPFLALAIILVFTWEYVKQFLPINDERASVANPAVIYDMRAEQEDLAPMGIEERMKRQEKFFSADDLKAEFSAAKTVSNADELAATLKAAGAGTVIALKAGEYRLNLDIVKDITLAGSGSSTILTAADPEQPVIKSTGAKVTLANLAIKDAKIGVMAEGGEAVVKRVKFDNLAATACYGAGVKLNFSESYIYNSLSALKFLNSSGEITDSIIKNNAKSGVELRQSEFKITGNVITNNKSYGAYVDGYSRADFSNNYIEGNSGWNVRVEGERKIYK